jgi:hypothetical protein
MVNCPLMKRKPGLRVAVKLKSVSVQCRTVCTVSVYIVAKIKLLDTLGA